MDDRRRDPQPAEPSTPNPSIKLKITNTQKQTPRQGESWCDERWFKLLVYVEWCAMNGKSFWVDGLSSFVQDVGHSYTKKAIQGKLRRSCPKYLTHKFDEKILLNSGVTYLNLPHDLHDRVQQVAGRIRQGGCNTSNGSSGRETAMNGGPHDTQNHKLFHGSQASNETRRDEPDKTVSERNTEPNDPASINVNQILGRSMVQPNNLNAGVEPSNDPQDRSDTERSGGNIPDRHSATRQMLKRTASSQFTQQEKSSLENHIFVLEEANSQLTREVKKLRHSKPDAQVRYYLEQHLRSTQEMVNRTKSPYREERELSKRSINRKCNLLFTNIRDACLDLTEVDNNLPGPEAQYDQRVQSWAHVAFYQDLRICLNCVSRGVLSKDYLLRGLISAAMIEYVFEPVFPDILNTESSASYPLRKYIVLKDGPDELHQADLYALESLVKGKESITIAQKAKALEDLVSKSLGPFCIMKSRDADRQLRQQSPDGNRGVLDLFRGMDTRSGLNLSGVLSSALKTKLDLTLNMTRLRYSFFSPEDLFDGTKMRMLSKPSEPSTRSVYVKACLFPAFFLAPPRAPDLSADECVLEYDTRYNTYFVEATREEVASLELVAHAIVLT
ncbi:hypothetical protein FSARC_4842 [Fusarium sarcochroum]|uniref:Uncharacterized protein n=1 Tax=Fusarium sarcochroum TaxID=1208366 RepID=A0A8H4U0U7_9HYPO|nr:hypothetical protein FSARC_4842 [Fusarium sarcochroum]